MKAELVKSIVSGKRTTFRQPVTGECRYRPNHCYTLRAATEQTPAVQITVLEVREERLGEITLRDVKREGHRTTQDFIAAWKGTHKSYDENQMVYVVSFARGDLTDTPHLLAARPGGSGGDYTTIPARAVRGEGEAVSPALLKQYAKDSAEVQTGIKRAEWREQRDRLMAVVKDIRKHALDPSARESLRGVERQIASLDRKMKTAA